MRLFMISAALLCGIGIPFGPATQAYGQTMMHEGHFPPAEHVPAERERPVEAGQSAFAAIAEIVDLLVSDPDTDWSRVDVGRLRAHLVDMDMLTLHADVETSADAQSVTFAVTGKGRVLAAIRAMVPAHARELNRSTPWSVETRPHDHGVIMTLASGSAIEREKIAALGFFGVMSLGAHHQAHHLAMAKGLLDGH